MILKQEYSTCYINPYSLGTTVQLDEIKLVQNYDFNTETSQTVQTTVYSKVKSHPPLKGFFFLLWFPITNYVATNNQ